MASLFRSSGPLAPTSAGEDVSDALLLDRFVDQWDQAAFRDLVAPPRADGAGRLPPHPRDAHAAEDAFQATFLLLVRKAGSVRKRGSVGPWLYGVARRVALEARARRLAATGADAVGPGGPAVDEHDDLERDELYAALHEELGGLPEKIARPAGALLHRGAPARGHGAAARVADRYGPGRIARGVTCWGRG